MEIESILGEGTTMVITLPYNNDKGLNIEDKKDTF